MPGRTIALLCVFFARSALAVDPFTVIAAGAATVNTVKTIAGTSKEAAEIGSSLSALSDLASEFEDPGITDDPDRLTRRIQEVEQLALQVGYTKDELEDILSESRDSKEKLSVTLNKLTRSIRLGKQILAIAGVSTKKAAEVAELEQTKSRNEEKKILIDIYSHLVTKDLEAKKAELKKQQQVTEAVSGLQAFIRKIAPGGNLNLFPVESSLIRKAVEVFQKYSRVLLILVSVIFVGRLIYYQISISPPEKYTDLVRDAFVCYFLMAAFPIVYSHLAEYSEALSLKLSKLLKVTGPEMPETKKLFGLPLPWWMQVEVLRGVAYLGVYGIFNVLLSVLIALGPIVVLAGTMLNFSISLPAYFAGIILIWLWPVIWNVVGFFAGLLWEGRSWTPGGIVEAVMGALFYAFQVFSPFVVINHLKRTQVGQSLTNSYRSARDSKVGQFVTSTAKTKAVAMAAGPAGVVAARAAHTAGWAKKQAASVAGRPQVLTGKARFE